MTPTTHPSNREKRMDIQQGRRKSFNIEYVVVTEDNLKEVALWCGGVVGGEDKDRFVKIVDKGAINQMQTKAFIGDIVVHHQDLDTFKKFGRKAFGKSYEEIDTEVVHRDATDGQYVSEEYAGEHPSTTVRETEEVSRPVGTTELPRDADPS